MMSNEFISRATCWEAGPPVLLFKNSTKPETLDVQRANGQATECIHFSLTTLVDRLTPDQKLQYFRLPTRVSSGQDSSLFLTISH